jgi:hypothetical protein
VRRWANITAVNDPVAAGRPPAAVFSGLVELAVGWQAHDPEQHLCSVASRRAVAEGLP